VKLRTFKICFKLYYRELCDWGYEYVKAQNQQTALRKFRKKHSVENAYLNDPESWRWWEDDWYYAFHLIEKVATTSEHRKRREFAGVWRHHR